MYTTNRCAWQKNIEIGSKVNFFSTVVNMLFCTECQELVGMDVIAKKHLSILLLYVSLLLRNWRRTSEYLTKKQHLIPIYVDVSIMRIMILPADETTFVTKQRICEISFCPWNMHSRSFCKNYNAPFFKIFRYSSAWIWCLKFANGVFGSKSKVPRHGCVKNVSNVLRASGQKKRCRGPASNVSLWTTTATSQEDVDSNFSFEEYNRDWTSFWHCFRD